MVFQNILFRMSGKRVLCFLWVICVLVKSQTLTKLEKIACFDGLNLREVTLSFKKSMFIKLKDYGVFIACRIFRLWCIFCLMHFFISVFLRLWHVYCVAYFKIIVYLLPNVILGYGVFIYWCICCLVYFKIMVYALADTF